MRLAPWPCMLCPTNIFTSSPSSTPWDCCQRSKIFFWNYFNLTSAEKAQSCKYIQILADPFSVLPKPFMWVDLLFRNYLIILKAPPPSTTSIKESRVKIHFSKLIPTPHLETMCVNESRGGICRKGKIPDLSQADTSYYQVHKMQPITKHHILLLGFAITTQKPTKICQVSCKNQSRISARVSDDISSLARVSDDTSNPRSCK